MQNPNTYSRRAFLRTSSCRGAMGISALSTLSSLMTVSKVMGATYDFSAPGDYKALICLFKFGGNDSFNMLVPTTTFGTTNTAPYDEYVARRTNLIALNRVNGGPGNGPALLPLTYNSALTNEYNSISSRLNNWNFGLHPNMPKLQALYNTDKKAAFLANVGSLYETVADKGELATKQLPVGLYSHSDMISSWQTLQPELRGGKDGWAARMADLIYDAAITDDIFLNISLAGSEPILMGGGQFINPYRMSGSGAAVPTYYTTTAAVAEAKNTLNALLGQAETSYSNILDKTVRATQKRALDALGTYGAIVDAVTDADDLAINNAFSDTLVAGNSVAQQLKTVARLIGGRNQVGAKRQIFFVGLGGWDQHDRLLTDQAENLTIIDDAIGAFATALKGMSGGVWNRSCLFSCSDFGRTLTPNDDGTDHAWGGNTFVIGGGVRGGMVYGKYPRLAATVDGSDNPLDTGRGRFIPTTPVDLYLVDLLRWFGITDAADLNKILPNRNNFAGVASPNIMVG